MKKISILILILFILSNCSSTQQSTNTIKTKEGIANDWYYYSLGLYYKSEKDYQKAIKYFLDAAAYETEQDKVYYQLAECYYGLYDYDNAINYSRLSIKKNSKNSKPYLLMYNIYMNLQNYERAAEILESLLDLRPELVNIHYLIANIYYMQLKNWEKAMVYFRNIIEINKSNPVEEYYLEYANYYMGHIYYTKGNIDKSIDHFNRTIQINPENYSAVYVLAFIFMDQYNLDQARKYSLMYLQKFSENVKMNSLTGRIYFLQNDHQAMRYLRQGANSQDVEGILSRALYLELLHRDDDSEKLLRDLLKKNTQFISPHIALARIGLRKGNQATALSEFFTAGVLMYKVGLYKGAQENLLKALSFNNTIPEIYFYLARSYEESEKISTAIIYYKKANELRPSADLLVHLGYLYSVINNYSQASNYFDKVIELEPENSKPYFFMGIMQSKKDNYPAAEKFIKKAVSLNEENDTYLFYLATVLEKQNKLEETIETLKKAIQNNPKNSRACNFLGYLYADNKINIDESIELIKKALEYEPSNGAYFDSLGWAYYRKGDYKRALKNLIEAEELLAKEKLPDPVVFDHIGDTYREIGDQENSLIYWKKSTLLKKNPAIEKKIKEVEKKPERSKDGSSK